MDEKRKKRITNILLEKYNIDIDNIEKTPQFISLRDTYLTTGKTPSKNKLIRYCCLVTMLKSRNLILRDDSKLCKNYINGDDTYDLDAIINTMDEMNWFYNHSTYEHHMDILYNENTYDKYYKYDNDKHDKYDNDKHDMSSIAKERAINDWICSMKQPIPPLSLKNIIQKKLFNKIDDIDFSLYDILNKFHDDKYMYDYSCKIAEKYNPWITELEMYKYIYDKMNVFIHNKLCCDIMTKIKNNDIEFIDEIDNYFPEFREKILNIYNKYKNFIFCKNENCLNMKENDIDLCIKCIKYNEYLQEKSRNKCAKCKIGMYGQKCKYKCCKNCCKCDNHKKPNKYK
jgi:hypothetical protein